MKDYPTRWQRKMMWAALTACFVVVLVVVIAAAVTAIFIAIQNLEGLLYAPRIVRNYVGLNSMTVIVSIFVWGVIIGEVIGPLADEEIEVPTHH
jgi:predicted PurR-regulated permease PerM